MSRTFINLLNIYSMFFLLIWGFLPNLIGQKVALSNEVTIRSNSTYDVMGEFNHRVIMLQDNGRRITLFVFDADFQAAQQYYIVPPQNSSDVYGYVPVDSSLYIYYVYPDSGYNMLALQKISMLDFSTYNSRTLFRMKRSETGNFRLVVSKDHSKHMIRYGKSDTDYEVAIFDTVKDSIFHTVPVVLDSPWEDGSISSQLLTSSGDYYLIAGNPKRKNNYEYTLYTIKSGIFKSTQFRTEEPLTEPKLVERGSDHLIFLTGIYLDAKQDLQAGLFLANMDQLTSTGLRLNKVTFQEQVLSDFYGREKQPSNGINDLVFSHIISQKDGSQTLVYEQQREIYRSNMPGRNAYVPGAMSIDFYRENILLVNVDNNLEVQWQKVLHKKQYSYDDDAQYSSFFMHENPSALRLLYNDEIKRSNTISEYIVTCTGQVSRRVLFSTDHSDLNLQIRNSTQVSAASTVIPSIRKNKLRLVKLNYN